MNARMLIYWLNLGRVDHYVGQIEERYARVDTRRSYDWLSARGHLSEGERKYGTINGTNYYVGYAFFHLRKSGW